MMNEQFNKIVPNLPTGTDELQRAAGYSWYWESDAHACYHAFPLAEGRSREALAMWTPIGLLQPTVLPFGQKNAGTHAQGPYRVAMSELSADAKQHMSNYMDDFMGFGNDLDLLCSHFEEFLQVCQKNNVTLNPHKTKVGYTSADFFGFTADKSGTHLAEKHLNPLEKMVALSDVSGVRRILSIFQQNRRYLGKDYAMIVKPLTDLTRGRKPEFRWVSSSNRLWTRSVTSCSQACI